MNVSGSRATNDINLEEFERRLRAAGAQQANVEDPLQELARLVESSYVGSSNSETSARPVSEPDKRGAESARWIETESLRPAIDATDDLIPAASESDRPARQDYEFDAPRSYDPQPAVEAVEPRPRRWKLAASALALAGLAMIGAVFALKGQVPCQKILRLLPRLRDRPRSSRQATRPLPPPMTPASLSSRRMVSLDLSKSSILRSSLLI